MADGGGSRAVSEEPDDFDIMNAEELPTEEDEQTPAVSTLEDEESADVETEDEDIPDDVGPVFPISVILNV